MKFTLAGPCAECPFLKRFAHAFILDELEGYASGAFPCHKTAAVSGVQFVAKEGSIQCAGALIFLEKRGRSSNWMRIAERLGAYDHTKLDMTAEVR